MIEGTILNEIIDNVKNITKSTIKNCEWEKLFIDTRKVFIEHDWQ